MHLEDKLHKKIEEFNRSNFFPLTQLKELPINGKILNLNISLATEFNVNYSIVDYTK